MKYLFRITFYLLIASLLAANLMVSKAVAVDIPIVVPQGYYCMDGDDPIWSEQAFDHSTWRFQADRRIDVPDGIRWVRAPIYMSEEYMAVERPLSVIVGAMASSEVYWNGTLIGKNGVPAASQREEVPGAITARHYLPPSLIKPGFNIIAVKLSSQQLKTTRGDIDLEIIVSPFLDISHARLRRHVPALLLFGAIGASVILFGSMYGMHRRDKGALWLALTFLMLAGQFGAEIYKGLVNYSYPVQLYRYVAIILFSYGSVLCLLLSILWRLQSSNRTRMLALVSAHMAAAIVAPLVFPLEAMLHAIILCFVGACLVLALIGVFQKKTESIPLVIGLLIVCAAGLEGPTLFLDRGYFYGMALLAAILFVIQAKDFRRSEQQAVQAAAQSTRMELELVKKHIQPHFMMNTLGALSEWIIENPKASVDMIQVLADEFRLLNEISSKEKVPLSQEIALCEAHLKIMSYRQDQQLLLDVDVQDEMAEIPPAIFHTLLENALTHNRYGIDTVVFTLRQRLIDTGQVLYEFVAPPGEMAAKETKTKQGHGLGLAYVEARLQEVWPDGYRMEDGRSKDGGWQTTIIVGMNGKDK